MPTGYTAGVADGTITDFKEYALQCARAFGACVMLRDDPLSDEIPEFEVNSYYSSRVEDLKRELNEFMDMNYSERHKLYELEQAQRTNAKEEGLSKKKEEKDRYKRMLKLAKKFKPPSPDHDSYAKFLVTQLEASIDFDCNTQYYDNLLNPSFDTWRDEKLYNLVKDIERAKESLKEEQDRVAGRNKWIKQLKEAIECHQ